MSTQVEAEAVAAIEAAEKGPSIDVEAAAAILDGIRDRLTGEKTVTVSESQVQSLLLLAILDEQRREREAFEALGAAVSQITSGGILNLLRKGGA